MLPPILTVTVLSLVSQTARADAGGGALQCSSILQSAAMNVEEHWSKEAREAAMYSQSCGVDMTAMSDALVASLSMNVVGYGSGSAGYARATAEQKLRQWCDTNSGLAKSSAASYDKSQLVVERALTEFNRCIELSDRKVAYAVTTTGVLSLTLDSYDSRDIEVFSVASPGFERCSVWGYAPGGILGKKQKSDGSALMKQGGLTTDYGAVTFECIRAKPVKVSLDGTEYERSPSASLAISTNDVPIIVELPEILVPTLPADRLAAELASLRVAQDRAIGEAVPFYFPADSAEKRISAMAPFWLPAWGQKVSDPASPYDGVNLPDLQGKVALGAKPGETASTGGATSVSFQVKGQSGESQLGPTRYGRGNYRGTPPDDGMVTLDTPGNEEGGKVVVPIDIQVLAPLPEPPNVRLVYMIRVR